MIAVQSLQWAQLSGQCQIEGAYIGIHVDYPLLLLR